MSLQFWRSPGQGSKDTDPLLEAALPPQIEDDYLKTDDEEGELVLGGLPKELENLDTIEVPLDHSRYSSDYPWDYWTMNG